MKKLMFLVWLLPFFAKSQDVLILKSGEELKGKVIEVGTEEIKYKKSESSPLYSIKKCDVTMIKYEDGSKDIFNVNYMALGDASFLNGDNASAINYYIKELEINPSSVYNDLECTFVVQQYVDKNDFDTAIYFIRQCMSMKLSPGCANYNILGALYYKKGDKDQAQYYWDLYKQK